MIAACIGGMSERSGMGVTKGVGGFLTVNRHAAHKSAQLGDLQLKALNFRGCIYHKFSVAI
ncbi:MAG: hypothetical protein AAF700_14975 [Pseudomonadota bacterium]